VNLQDLTPDAKGLMTHTVVGLENTKDTILGCHLIAISLSRARLRAYLLSLRALSFERELISTTEHRNAELKQAPAGEKERDSMSWMLFGAF